MIQIGISLAVCCALVTNLAFFYKQRGATLAPAVKPGHPLRSARDLFRSRWFTIGMLVAAVAWILHVAAMTFAPLVGWTSYEAAAIIARESAPERPIVVGQVARLPADHTGQLELIIERLAHEMVHRSGQIGGYGRPRFKTLTPRS